MKMDHYNNVVLKEKKRWSIGGFPWTFTTYILTETKLIIRSGILMLREEEIELYKVTDKTLFIPLSGRIFKHGTIRVTSNDVSSPFLLIKNIANFRNFYDTLEKYVDIEKDKYHVKGRDVIGNIE